MTRFRIVVIQGYSFDEFIKKNNVKPPAGFIKATDDHFDPATWEITSYWENKAAFDEAAKHPLRKMFWNRFEFEAFKHELDLIVTDGDTGEEFRPLEF